MVAMRSRRDTRRGRTIVSKASHRPPVISARPSRTATNVAMRGCQGDAALAVRRPGGEAEAPSGLRGGALHFDVDEAGHEQPRSQRVGIDGYTRVAGVQITPVR